MKTKHAWRKLSGQRISIPILEEVTQVLTREQSLGYEIKVCIGTDSQVKSRETEFATVIVFVRKGHGAFMYIHNETTIQRMSVKERMLAEVAKSIEVAYELCNVISVFGVDMEVHADINTNPNFKSNDALKEAMGTFWEWVSLSEPSRKPLRVRAVRIKWCNKKCTTQLIK